MPLKSGPSSLPPFPLFSLTFHVLFQYPVNWPCWYPSLPIQALPPSCCQSDPSKKEMLVMSLPYKKAIDDFRLLKDKNVTIKSKDSWDQPPIPFKTHIWTPLLPISLLTIPPSALNSPYISPSQHTHPLRHQPVPHEAFLQHIMALPVSAPAHTLLNLNWPFYIFFTRQTLLTLQGPVQLLPIL